MRILFIDFSVDRDERIAEDFVASATEIGNQLGLSISKPREIAIDRDTPPEFERAIQQNVVPSTQFVVCMLPTSREDRYEAVKTALITQRPVPSQCIVAKTLNDRKKFKSVVYVVFVIPKKLNIPSDFRRNVQFLWDHKHQRLS